MLIDRKARMLRRQKNREEKADYLKDREDLVAIKAEKVRKQYEAIEKRISDLQAKQGELYAAPLSREDYGKIVKECFFAAREQALSAVIDHVKQEHGVSGIPLSLEYKYILKPHKQHHLLWLALTEEDIDRIIERLPDGGMTVAERDDKIKAIDKEIKKVRASLKDELEKEKGRAT